MTLEDLGYSREMECFRKEQQLDAFGVGRVTAVHRERYVVKTAEREYEGEIIGNLRFTARNQADFPVVGDWVAISEYDEGKVLIHAVFPRKTVIERQAAGKQGEKQIIASNIDYALIVQAADRDFNLNRAERYLTICNTSGVKPLLVLNKTDLIGEEQLERLRSLVLKRIEGVPLFCISNETGEGIKDLNEHIEKGRTYCLLGSSGVGKSTLTNILSGNSVAMSGKSVMKTGSTSESTGKGRHVTSHRELLVLGNGGLLIDNPGMREVGIADSAEGLEITFDMIGRLARECRFRDCTHVSEEGCAVIAAVDRGEIDRSVYENFLKMEREKEHFESTIAEKRQKDKDFGKMVKEFKKQKSRGRHD